MTTSLSSILIEKNFCNLFQHSQKQIVCKYYYKFRISLALVSKQYQFNTFPQILEYSPDEEEDQEFIL